MTMATRLPECTKIHEGCGGICEWVEATHTPGVGYHGRCQHCGRGQVVVEQMIPIESVDQETIEEVRREVLADLSWDENADWSENQRMLRDAIEESTTA